MNSPWGASPRVSTPGLSHHHHAGGGLASTSSTTATTLRDGGGGGGSNSLSQFIARSTSAPPPSSEFVIKHAGSPHGDALVGNDLLEHMSRAYISDSLGHQQQQLPPWKTTQPPETTRTFSTSQVSTDSAAPDDSDLAFLLNAASGRSTAPTSTYLPTASSNTTSSLILGNRLPRPLSASAEGGSSTPGSNGVIDTSLSSSTSSISGALGLPPVVSSLTGGNLVRSKSAAPSIQNGRATPGNGNGGAPSIGPPPGLSFGGGGTGSKGGAAQPVRRSVSAAPGLCVENTALRPAAKTLMDLIQEDYPNECNSHSNSPTTTHATYLEGATTSEAVVVDASLGSVQSKDLSNVYSPLQNGVSTTATTSNASSSAGGVTSSLYSGANGVRLLRPQTTPPQSNISAASTAAQYMRSAAVAPAPPPVDFLTGRSPQQQQPQQLHQQHQLHWAEPQMIDAAGLGQPHLAPQHQQLQQPQQVDASHMYAMHQPGGQAPQIKYDYGAPPPPPQQQRHLVDAHGQIMDGQHVHQILDGQHMAAPPSQQVYYANGMPPPQSHHPHHQHMVHPQQQHHQVPMQAPPQPATQVLHHPPPGSSPHSPAGATTVYVHGSGSPHQPGYGYTTVHYHTAPPPPHRQQQIIHHHPGAQIAHGAEQQQYVSVVPVQTGGAGGPHQVTYWQHEVAHGAPGQAPGLGQTVTILNALPPGAGGPGGPHQIAVARVASGGQHIPGHHHVEVVAAPHVAAGAYGGGNGRAGRGDKGMRGSGGGGGRRGGPGSGRRGESKNSAHPATSPLLDEFRATKNRDWTMHQIVGHVVEFCQDQNGSRFIQQRLELGDMTEQQIVVGEVLPAIRRLRNDVFGNYVVQKLLDFGSPQVKSSIRETLEGEMLQLSLQMYGCRVVQKALEALTEEDIPGLLIEFHHNVLSCIHDQNGNHVIQKCIEVVSTRAKRTASQDDEARAAALNSKIDFIIKDVLVNTATLSCHPYGCRVLQRILEHCEEGRKTDVLEEIRNCHRKLLDDQYGNYVIQHVLQFGRAIDRDSILSIVVEAGLLGLSRQKFASNVVEKLLKYGNSTQRRAIVREMLKKGDDASMAPQGIPGSDASTSVVLLMVRDAYANYVVQTTLDVVPDSEEKVMLLEELNSHSDELRQYTFAKHIVAKLAAMNTAA